MCNSYAWCISLFACNGQFCIYVGSLLFRYLWYILESVILIKIMSCIFNILRFLSKGAVCTLYVLIAIIVIAFLSLIILSH